jgi:hypothetical protein
MPREKCCPARRCHGSGAEGAGLRPCLEEPWSERVQRTRGRPEMLPPLLEADRRRTVEFRQVSRRGSDHVWPEVLKLDGEVKAFGGNGCCEAVVGCRGWSASHQIDDSPSSPAELPSRRGKRRRARQRTGFRRKAGGCCATAESSRGWPSEPPLAGGSRPLRDCGTADRN